MLKPAASKVIFTSILLISTLVAQTITTVTGEGYGSTKSIALAGAKRSAVEQGVGVVIASETLVENFAVVNDRILSKANGFIKNYTELSSREESPGVWTVRISAVVTDILDELVKDQMAMDLLLSWVRHPRFMIMIEEVNIEDTNSTIAATEIGRLLGAKGFDLVSATQIESIRQRNTSLASVSNDATAVALAGAELGAEYIILGNASAKAVSLPILGNRLSGQANITAQVIRADNGQIIAQESFQGKSTHIDGNIAGVNALKMAGKKLAEYLMAETVKKWSMEQSNSRMLSVKISGVTFSTRKQISDYLEFSVNGVVSVSQRSFVVGTVTLVVQFTGTNEDLGMALDGHDFGSYIIFVSGMSANGLELQVQAKQ